MKVERFSLVGLRCCRQSVLGYALLSLWLLCGIGLVWFIIASWNIDLVKQYGPRYLSGLGVTLSLVSISIIAGAVLSIPLAYGSMSKKYFFSFPATVYLAFFRGTPLLAQCFLIYYGVGEFRPQLEAVGLWVFFRSAWICAIVALSLNTAAYQAEILRGAIQSVPRGQWEAATALGLGKLQIMREIIVPQALIVALRPYGNEVILSIKGSAIFAVITVYDLFGVTRLTYSVTFDFQAYVWAAIIYLLITLMLHHGIEWIEARLTRHLMPNVERKLASVRTDFVPSDVRSGLLRGPG